MKVIVDGAAYCCGTCALWRRSVGCTMRATPATVNCGRTRFHDLCEQWYPSHISKRARRRWKVRSTPGCVAESIRVRFRVAALYAIYGADS